jgi:hypothetical protein
MMGDAMGEHHGNWSRLEHYRINISVERSNFLLRITPAVTDGSSGY